MFEHAGSGYAGNGTLCGALGVSSAIINLVVYDPDKFVYVKMIRGLMDWYSRMEFPTTRFDHLSKYPNQVKAPAETPLCHTSVSNWTIKAGVEVNSKEKYERCAKTAAEVVYTTVHYLNQYFYGEFEPMPFMPSEAAQQCLTCHSSESYFDGYTDGFVAQIASGIHCVNPA